MISTLVEHGALAGHTRHGTAAAATRLLGALLVMPLAMLLSGCGGMPVTDRMLGMITPYRIDIVQGNVVTSEQAALVKPGMRRLQVRDILGSPMLTDIFHADRWDYVFTMVRPGSEPQRRNVVAHFKGDVLERLDAPNLPSEREFVAGITVGKSAAKPPALELTEAERKALPVPARNDAATKAPTGPTRNYPPLEPV